MHAENVTLMIAHHNIETHTMTIAEATIPCDIANPALRIANILKAPPGTQNTPTNRWITIQMYQG